MYPILLQIGPITIYSLWIMIAIGFFASLLIINKLVQKNRMKLSFLADHSLVIFFGGLILSRIIYVFRDFNTYFNNFSLDSVPQLFYVWDKGLSVWGGVLGIALTLIYFCHKSGEDKFKWLDIATIAILAALAFGNIGAFLDGRNYGRETNLPWGVMIENSIYAVPIHPTQIYAAIYCGLLSVGLFKLFDSKIAKVSGNISIIGLGLYSFFRFLEEFLRGDESTVYFGLREAQIYALLAFIISGILFYVQIIRKNKKSSISPNP
jgi:phosphatidylglycerol:prolipoprotein diacylglycerol transferase